MASEPWAGEGGIVGRSDNLALFRHLDGDGLPSYSAPSALAGRACSHSILRGGCQLPVIYSSHGSEREVADNGDLRIT